jgi:hypothetical protein
VAYALAQSGGFQTTELFRQDPDYELVAGWYRQMEQLGTTAEPVLEA